jgi:hypothetical protein
VLSIAKAKISGKVCISVFSSFFQILKTVQKRSSMEEQLNTNEQAAGSNPAVSTKSLSSSMVEHFSCKEGVVSSNLTFGSVLSV